VRANGEHGPTLVRIDGQTWVMAITPVKGKMDQVSAFPLDGDGAESVILDPGLQNIKSIDAAVYAPGNRIKELRIALVAQGYREMKGADQSRDKTFVYILEQDELNQKNKSPDQHAQEQ